MDPNHGELDIVSILIEFIEVTIHHLLYLRKLYPQSIFVLKKMYGVPVHVSKHPELNQYITESLRSARELAQCNMLRSLSVCFYEGNQHPNERIVFDILGLKEKYRPNQNFSDPYLLHLKEGLRTVCLRLAVANFKPLSERSSFQIHILTTEQGSQKLSYDPASEDFPWVELGSDEKDLPDPSLEPIKTLDWDFLKLQVYSEVCRDK